MIRAILLVLAFAANVATAAAERAADVYFGADDPWLPTGRDALKSVRGLHRYIREHIPGVGAKSGAAAPLDLVKKHADMPFLKFDSHEAVPVSAFRDSVLAKEADIIAARLRPDLADGLDLSKTMTSRSDRYNIFYWEEPWVGAYYWLIKRAFHRYLSEYGLKPTKTMYVHSWANCLRTGQKLEWHNHGEEGEWSVSGTYVVSAAAGSATFYRVPRSHRVFQNPNAVHDLVMFDSLLDHQTSTVDRAQSEVMNRTLASECRITSSWDIHEEPGNVWHSVPLYDPLDPEWSRDPTAHSAVLRGRRALENDRRIEELEALAADPLAQRTRWGDISHARDPSDSQADVHARTRAKGDEAEGESVGQKTAQFRTNGEDVMVRLALAREKGYVEKSTPVVGSTRIEHQQVPELQHVRAKALYRPKSAPVLRPP